MNDPEKLLVSKSGLEYLQEVVAKERDCGASEYIKGHASGIGYALRILGLMEEAKS